jgi:hypothetical protein
MSRVALLVAVLVLLSGCSIPFSDTSDGTPGDEIQGTPTATVDHDERADPDSDQLGWENGYWHDDPVAVDASDGLNESEREAVVSRAMARVEVVRNLEFERTVNVTVISRSNFSSGGGGDRSAAFRTFDNAKFEALFLIGNQEDSIETQEETRNQTVAGFYSSSREAIVLVSDSETPDMDGERTLAHELVHALQDQHFDLPAAASRTRDAHNGRNGLVEGDASAVEAEYLDRCGDTWSCLPSENEQTGGNDSDGGEDSESDDSPSINLGVYVLSYFPYSDGPGFVEYLRDGDDWSRVNDAFENPPASSAAVISPERYPEFEPVDVELRDRTADGWTRVRPDDRPDYAVLGQSALTAMFAYTLYDEYNRSGAVRPQEFLNMDGGSVDRTDPFNYSLTPVRGWQGDRMHVYERGDESGYAWRLVWESPADAERFADRYRTLLSHWGGSHVDPETWVIEEGSPFADAFHVAVEGDTVTIVNAPSRAALSNVYRGAG